MFLVWSCSCLCSIHCSQVLSWEWRCSWISTDRRCSNYSISQEICTRFCCALLCCGFVIVHNEFTWSIIHIHQGCFAGTGAMVRLPQYQWSKPDGHGKISQCITTTKHSKAQTMRIFLGIYCTSEWSTIVLPTKVWLILEVWRYVLLASKWYVSQDF